MENSEQSKIKKKTVRIRKSRRKEFKIKSEGRRISPNRKKGVPAKGMLLRWYQHEINELEALRDFLSKKLNRKVTYPDMFTEWKILFMKHENIAGFDTQKNETEVCGEENDGNGKETDGDKETETQL